MTTPLLAIPALALRGVAVRPDADAPALDVTFDTRRRHITALLGEIGSGKTATIRAIAGLDPLENGNVVVEGADVSARAPHLRGLGMVPHGLGLTPQLSAAESIRFGLRAARRSSMEREIRLAELLRLVDLGERGDVRVEHLSYLERLHLAIARSLTTEPVALLLDDPLGPLNDRTREEGRRALRGLLRRLTVSVLFTSTDAGDAAALADDVVVIDQGRVVQADTTAALLARPATFRVALLAGYEVMLQGHPEGDRVSELGVGSIPLQQHLSRESVVHFMAHPAGVLAVPRGTGLGFGVAGTVEHVRPLGPLWLVEVALGTRTSVLARWEWDAEPPAIGAQVELAATGGVRMYIGGGLYEEPEALPPPSSEVAEPSLRISSAG